MQNIIQQVQVMGQQLITSGKICVHFLCTAKENEPKENCPADEK